MLDHKAKRASCCPDDPPTVSGLPRAERSSRFRDATSPDAHRRASECLVQLIGVVMLVGMSLPQPLAPQLNLSAVGRNWIRFSGSSGLRVTNI